MKYIKLLLIVLAAVMLQSCGEEGLQADSYFYVSVNGPSWNGEFTITGSSMNPIVASALISPSGDPGIPDVMIISYGEPGGGVWATMTIPGEKRLTELTDDHEFFGMGMGDGVATADEILLISKSVSMHITKLKTTTGGFLSFNIPSAVVGNYEGVMIHERWDMGVKIEESHTVKGDFKFYQ